MELILDMNDSGGRLSNDRRCHCRKAPRPHVHRWQIDCPICGYRYACESPRTYELPDHMVVGIATAALDGIPIDDDDEIEESSDDAFSDEDIEDDNVETPEGKTDCLSFDQDVDDPNIKRRVPNERECTGSGFRRTAILAVWETF